jgi:hypothetical protein
MSSRSTKGTHPMATVPIQRLSKAELRLQEHRRERSSISREVKGTPAQLRKEDRKILKSLRQERDEANAQLEE